MPVKNNFPKNYFCAKIRIRASKNTHILRRLYVHYMWKYQTYFKTIFRTVGYRTSKECGIWLFDLCAFILKVLTYENYGPSNYRQHVPQPTFKTEVILKLSANVSFTSSNTSIYDNLFQEDNTPKCKSEWQNTHKGHNYCDCEKRMIQHDICQEKSRFLHYVYGKTYNVFFLTYTNEYWMFWLIVLIKLMMYIYIFLQERERLKTSVVFNGM